MSSRGGGAGAANQERRSRWHEAGDFSLDRRLALDLFRQGLGAVGEDDARDSLQEDPVFFRQLFAAAEEDSARFVHLLRFRADSDQAQDAVLQNLTIPGEILVENDQISD